MLDRYQKKVLKALVEMEQAREPFSYTELMNRSKVLGRHMMPDLCRDLKAKGFIKLLAFDLSENIQGIKLDHKGRIYKEVIKAERIRYIKEKWIDFFALLSSVAALVISIVSLLLKSPS